MNFEFLNSAVKRQQILGDEPEDQVSGNDPIHIAYGIDDKFVMPMGIAIISILDHNKQENIIFHVLVEGLRSENINYLKKLADDYKTKIVVHYIDGKIFEHLPTTEHFTKATYNRFLLTKVLKNITKRIIYVDADILCYGSITALKTLDFQGNIVAVVQDIGAVAKRQIPILSLKNQQYFNAGFLYIDIQQWEQNDISEKALEFSFANVGKLNWLDQDALNAVLNDKALFMKDEYNYIFDFGVKENRHITQLPQEIVFVHYAGRYKPWHVWCMHPLKKDFIKYLQTSPWCNVKPQQPQNYKEMKKMAQSYMLYGEVLKSIIWYTKYVYYKIMNRG